MSRDNSTAKEGVFTLGQRISLWVISHLAALLLTLIGLTLRFESSSEMTSEDATASAALPPPRSIACLWHRCGGTATYYFRHRGISVMTSRSFDGEFIARTMSLLGFDPVRGSSSRGGIRALLGMHTVIERGGVATFTIDGPRGPRSIAKPGPVLLARNTGAPIRCFYMAHSRYWELNSWDRMQIPKPFARVHIRWSKEIHVPKETDSAGLEKFHSEMQQALERVTAEAEARVK